MLSFYRLPVYRCSLEKISGATVYFCSRKPKTTKSMDEEKKTDVNYQRYGDITAKVITNKGDANLRPMTGRMLINSFENELNFRE